MLKLLFKRVFFITLLCLITTVFINISLYKDNALEAVNIGERHSFLYERIGSDKGIFLYEPNKEVKKISNLYSDDSYIDKDIKISVISEKDFQSVYITNINDELDEKRVKIITGYKLISEIERFSSNVYMVLDNDKEVILLTYNILTGESIRKPIITGIDSYIRDVKFTKPSEVIYARKLKNVPDSYNIYSYDFNDNKERNVIKHKVDILDPIISPNKEMLSYLKKESGSYQLFIYNIKDKTEKRVNLNDGVVSGSIRWSLDSKYILCNTFNEGTLNRMNVVNLTSGRLIKINNAYSGMFSANNDCVLFASYNKEENIQYIYSYNLLTNKKSEIYKVYEPGSFSKSLKLLKVY